VLQNWGRDNFKMAKNLGWMILRVDWGLISRYLIFTGKKNK